jgi:predicted nucleic acid-binding Zn ribbon protein
MSFRTFIKELQGERVEGELVKTVFYSLLTSVIFLGVMYLIQFKNMDRFLDKYGFFLLFSALSYAIIVPTVRQVSAYREMACMGGMMIGMTTGMIAGFLPGFFVASTNGMFFGGFFGVALGIGLGIWNGKCCGVMGILEGIMAGFMGGLMGAMTAFMLLNDHLKAAAVIIFAISAVIVVGLNYMIYKEVKERERERKEDNFLTFFITFILIAITTWMIVFGPRSGLFQ